MANLVASRCIVPGGQDNVADVDYRVFSIRIFFGIG